MMAWIFGDITLGMRFVRALIPVLTSAISRASFIQRCAPLSRSWQQNYTATAAPVGELEGEDSLPAAGQCAAYGVIQSGFGVIVVGCCNPSLLPVNF